MFCLLSPVSCRFSAPCAKQSSPRFLTIKRFSRVDDPATNTDPRELPPQGLGGWRLRQGVLLHLLRTCSGRSRGQPSRGRAPAVCRPGKRRSGRRRLPTAAHHVIPLTDWRAAAVLYILCFTYEGYFFLIVFLFPLSFFSFLFFPFPAARREYGWCGGCYEKEGYFV